MSSPEEKKHNHDITIWYADGFMVTAVVIVHHAPTCCSSDRPVIFQSKYTKFYFEKSIYMINYNF